MNRAMYMPVIRKAILRGFRRDLSATRMRSNPPSGVG